METEKPIRYVSFCAGVEAASQAWGPLGWEPVAFSEIEPFPCAVLAARYPAVPNLGDCRLIHYDRNTKELYVRDKDGTERDRFFAGDIDLCVGGFPCQSFSVAGKREGLEGASGLILEYFRLLAEIRPRWVVYENVPGMLSSSGGADFRLLLRKFAECGYDLCWRTLDTQYVRVERYPLAIPQRRRRVFLVGRLASDDGGGCEVLLEPEGLRGDPPPRRIKGQGAAGDPAARARRAGGTVECLTPSSEHPQTHRVYGTGGSYPSIMSNGGQAGQDQSGVLVKDVIAFKGGQSAAGGLGAEREVAQTMQRQMSALEPTVAISFLPTNSAHARSLGEAVEVAPTMARGGGESGNKPSVALQSVAVRTGHTGANGCGFQDEVTHTLGAGDLDAVAYKIDSTASNAMKSRNPKSGFHEVAAHSALDTTDPSPTKAQGGIALAVPVALRGNRRPGEEGKLAETDGREAAYSLTHVQTDSMVATKERMPPDAVTFTKTAHPSDASGAQGYERTDTAKTLNTFACSEARAEEVIAYENHATASRVTETETAPTQGATRNGNASNNNPLCCEPVGVDGFNARLTGGSAQTLTGARVDSMNNPLVGYRYAVRRITPVEAERLQGFADNWTVPTFAPADVTDELVDRFIRIHRAWAVMNGKPNAKSKSREQVREWLKKISSPATCPDGPRYKAVGNSMSVNVMTWVGMRIAEADASGTADA